MLNIVKMLCGQETYAVVRGDADTITDFAAVEREKDGMCGCG